MASNTQGKHTWWLLGIGLVLMIIILSRVRSLSQVTSTPDWTKYDRTQAQLKIKSRTLLVELVTTQDSIIQGLSDRTEIGSDGMLFILPTPQPAQFWMKDMLFDLDMVWISNQKIVGITARVPAPSPGTTLNNLPTYPAPQVVDMVLEVPAGFVEQVGWQVGDNLELQLP